MRLHAVANRFNDMVCTNAYTGAFVFKAQLGLFDDNKRDSETAERRVLSLAPDASVPFRRVINADGVNYILGHVNADDFRGRTIRVGVVAHEATFLSQVRTLAQVCEGTAGFTAWAGRAWVKDIAYSQQTSIETPLHHIHYSSDEPIAPDLIVSFEDRLSIVRTMNFGAGGTIVASCEQLLEPSIETAVIHTGVYDPVQDTKTDVTTTQTGVRMRWQALFSYRNSLAPKFEPGDIQIAFSTTGVAIVAGTTMQLSDGLWRVQSVVSEAGTWLCRATRYG